MHMCACVGTPYTHTHPHPYLPTPSTPKGGNPPNQLKCYNTEMNQDISILFEDLKYV